METSKHYRMVFKISEPPQSLLPIPDGHGFYSVDHKNFEDKKLRPWGKVIYTNTRDLILWAEDGTEETSCQFRGKTVETLMNHFLMEVDEYLEFESHSNTELTVRAYDSFGIEKNTGGQSTQGRIRCLVELKGDFRSGLAIKSTFLDFIVAGGSPFPCHLYTNKGERTVYGRKGSSDHLFLCGSGWKDFVDSHKLREGMVLVFESSRGFICNFNVLFYNPDGLGVTDLSVIPTESFPSAETSLFIRLGDHRQFVGNELWLGEEFTRFNSMDLNPIVKLHSPGGFFEMNGEARQCYGKEPQYVIWGDWDSLFKCNNAGKDLLLKLHISFNNRSSRIKYIYCVPFIDRESAMKYTMQYYKAFPIADNLIGGYLHKEAPTQTPVKSIGWLTSENESKSGHCDGDSG